jgi:hypothetical protein
MWQEPEPELLGASVPTAHMSVVVGDWLLLCCSARRDTATGYWSVLGFDERALAMHAPMHWLPPTRHPSRAGEGGGGGGTRSTGANRQAVRFAARQVVNETTIALQLHRGGGVAKEEVVRVNLKLSVRRANGVNMQDPRFDPLKAAAALRRQAEQGGSTLAGGAGGDGSDMLPDEIAKASQAASQGALRALAVVLREAQGVPSLALAAGSSGSTERDTTHLREAADSRYSNALVPLLKHVVAAQQEQEQEKIAARAAQQQEGGAEEEDEVDDDGYPLPLVALVQDALARAIVEADTAAAADTQPSEWSVSEFESVASSEMAPAAGEEGAADSAGAATMQIPDSIEAELRAEEAEADHMALAAALGQVAAVRTRSWPKHMHASALM